MSDELLTSEPFNVAGFAEQGLLYMVNKTLFHPRGYALSVDADDGSFTLLGNGDEPWQYELPQDVENDRWNAFNALLASVTKK